MPLFTHPPFILNLYEFLSSIEHKKRNVEECVQPNINFHSCFFFQTMEVNGHPQLFE